MKKGKNMVKISISLEQDTLDAIDESRGLAPRSTFIDKVIMKNYFE